MINTPCIDRQALYNLYADYHAKKCSPLISKSLLKCLLYWHKYHQINNASLANDKYVLQGKEGQSHKLYFT